MRTHFLIFLILFCITDTGDKVIAWVNRTFHYASSRNYHNR